MVSIALFPTVSISSKLISSFKILAYYKMYFQSCSSFLSILLLNLGQIGAQMQARPLANGLQSDGIHQRDHPAAYSSSKSPRSSPHHNDSLPLSRAAIPTGSIHTNNTTHPSSITHPNRDMKPHHLKGPSSPASNSSGSKTPHTRKKRSRALKVPHN